MKYKLVSMVNDDCPVCKGTGFVLGIPCPKCNPLPIV